MSTARVLFDAPGPQARRRILIGTVVSLVAIAAVIYLAIRQFAENGQLDAAKWSPFLDPGIPSYIGRGLANTLKVTAVSAGIAFPAGALLALLRLTRTVVLRWLATAYIEFFRSTPLLLLVLVFVGALPALGINPAVFWKITIPVILVNSAVLAEVFRAGVRALPRGQGEAGLSLGLTYWQTMRLIILPQAIRIVIPSLVTQLVSLLKDSTLGYAASYAELMKTASNLTSFYHNFIQSYLVIALIYIVINLFLSYVARLVDRRLSRLSRPGARPQGRSGEPAMAEGDEQLQEFGAVMR